MNGWSYDYMLALDSGNCAAVKTQRDSKTKEISDWVMNEVKSQPTWMQTLFSNDD